ncbi:MAG: hypothetical protein QOI11_1045 [Candidatus Eremiobacteraeota bacterium]|jgi:hypothetical protein|nr:hypothetical protein [Candidatus Eremiobacteraeota bacterium]
MAEQAKGSSAVELITDPERVKSAAETPLITIRTGQTGGQTYHLKINQAQGRAVMIAVHL